MEVHRESGPTAGDGCENALVPGPDHPQELWRSTLGRPHPCRSRHVGELQFHAQIRVGPAGEFARVLRNAAADLLRAWGSGDLVDTVKLLLSEIFTNAVRHCAGRPADGSGQIHVTLCQSRDALTVNVEDPGGDLPDPARVKDPGPDAENGRGLLLLQSLASVWGAHSTQRGKTVWFALQRA
ncbi:ATP-binding protein [Kitasatospora sp. NPDC004240]